MLWSSFPQFKLACRAVSRSNSLCKSSGFARAYPRTKRAEFSAANCSGPEHLLVQTIVQPVVQNRSPRSFPKWAMYCRKRTSPGIGSNFSRLPERQTRKRWHQSRVRRTSWKQFPFRPSIQPSETQNSHGNKGAGNRPAVALCTLHSTFCIESLPARAISTKNKHLLLACATNPRFHGGSFGVWGHTSCKALKM